MSDGRANPRAFTLLEMLVAAAITAVLAGSLYATLHIAFTARRSATRAVEEIRQVELALEWLRADVQAAVVPSGILAGPFVGEASTGASGRAADALLLHCTAAASEAVEGTGDVRQVELVCEQEDDGTAMVLVRRVTANLLAPTTREPHEEVLCRDVYAFALRYFDGTDWLDAWDSTTQDNLLPLAVEVTLTLARAQPSETDVAGYSMSRVFLIPCSAIQPGVAMEVPLF
ncbi:MAG TPA: type II secretion system protein GspJ [Phycisphaerae bacterium]|nr:type II secretion system protein GspJ [Phycisphaerae bacterium]